jgi:hypothetical protein
MTIDLETELRDTLSARVHALDLSASLDRLRSANYRVRRSRLSPRLTIGGLASGATAGAIAAVVLVGGAPPAFAGWTATPTTPSTAQLTATSDSCQSSLANAPSMSGVQSTSWQPVVTDVRGPFTVVLYDQGSAYASCFTGPDFTLIDRNTSNAGMTSVSASSFGQSSGALGARTAMGFQLLSGGDISHLDVSHLESSTDGPYTLVDGQVEADVSAVTLELSDGSSVQTSIEDGWVLAWWPGDQDVTSALVTSSSGTTTQPLTQIGPPAGAPGPGSLCASDGSSPTSASCGGNSSNPGTGG